MTRAGGVVLEADVDVVHTDLEVVDDPCGQASHHGGIVLRVAFLLHANLVLVNLLGSEQKERKKQ